MAPIYIDVLCCLTPLGRSLYVCMKGRVCGHTNKCTCKPPLSVFNNMICKFLRNKGYGSKNLELKKKKKNTHNELT